MRRRQRRLLSWWRHEQQSVAAALAAAHHHSYDRMGKTKVVECERQEEGGPRDVRCPTGTEVWLEATARASVVDGLPTFALPVLAGSAGEAIDSGATTWNTPASTRVVWVERRGWGSMLLAQVFPCQSEILAFLASWVMGLGVRGLACPHSILGAISCEPLCSGSLLFGVLVLLGSTVDSCSCAQQSLFGTVCC